FWYVFTRRRVIYDLLFLLVIGVVVILRIWKDIYVVPEIPLRVDILGKIMWIRLAMLALMLVRGWEPESFGFWPSRREWKSGITYFVLGGPALSLLAVMLGFGHFGLQGPWWRVAGLVGGTFFGMLWVVSLSEELFFRGMLQRTLTAGGLSSR